MEVFLDSGGVTVGPFTEYHRSARLADEVRQALHARDTRSDRGLDAATAASEFTTWLRASAADRPELPEDLDELAAELADSWCISGIEVVYATCSPHRVALCVPHLHNYYEAEFAEQLVALLPEWIRWLSERNGTPPVLADRCLPHTQGEPHPQIATDDDSFARVIE